MKRRVLCFFSLFCAALMLLCSCEKESIEEIVQETPEKTRTVLETLNVKDEEPYAQFAVCLRDKDGAPLSGKMISVSCGNAFSASLLTDSDGVAFWETSLGKGEYAATYSFLGDETYQASVCKTSLQIAERQNRSGVYVLGKELDLVDFEALSQNKIDHIFLRQDAVSIKGREVTQSFIATAASYGIKVHLWLICLWDNGGFVNPFSTETGTYNQAYFDSEIAKAKSLASLSGLYGIHLDYIRYDGSEKTGERADKYNFEGKTGADAVSEFVRQMCEAVRSVNSSLVLSGAIMPFYETLYDRFGQDVPTLSQYFDFLVPMTYTGNCNEDAAWITGVVRWFRKNALSCEIWAGLLSYQSDTDSTTLPAETVRAEARAAYDGGAKGIVLFLYSAWADGTPTMNLFDMEP